MDGNSNKAPKRSSVLRTTTWGAVIAASVVLAAFGFQGHLLGLGPNGGQVASNIPLNQLLLPRLFGHSKTQPPAPSNKVEAPVAVNVEAVEIVTEHMNEP